ncbi:thermonuclease family protein [Agrobacterium arsenijevicii]|uniref:Succinoglycan biosynthesis protein exoi n=1 Tax=Agrobacterium arsenijevicii TaxID=1585697 RepID=A0ABR5CZQ0_9HYPH|nr:succinoglycan biosynthesis protein exoi [Agrobacterium arsenijevicii]
MKRRLLAVLSLAMIAGQAVVAAPAGYFDFTTSTVLETGDTWMSAGTRYRLYGLQACLRGTTYTDASGNKRDCGEASIAVLAAFVKDTRPVCAPVAVSTDLTFAICYAFVGRQRLDLAMMMISEGYGFASLDSSGMPIYPAYAVAEQGAREARRGLWQFNDVQHPAILLSRAARKTGDLP